MIPYALESMILNGEAVFQTITVGGSQKTILPVSKESYIVIISVTYFNRGTSVMNDAGLIKMETEAAITQLLIGSNTRMNTMVFRNNWNIFQSSPVDALHISPAGSTTIDTYLLHDQDVTFSFTDGQTIILAAAAPTPVNGTANNRPLDYGKAGQSVLPVAVHLQGAITAGGARVDFRFAGPEVGFPVAPAGKYTFPYVRFPVTDVSNNDGQVMSMPLAQISYVEVKGKLSTSMSANK